MFKKGILILTAITFALGILVISVVQTSALTASKNFKIAPATPTPAESSSSVEIQKEVDYFLAYPGILPDHFLYPIKMIRDRIRLSLTTDPLKKAEQFLLYADKRLGAAKALIEGGKQELGLTTLTKAEKYLEQAIIQERTAREKSKETIAFLEKLLKATLKHEEVILNINEKLNNSAVEKLLDYSRQGYAQVTQALGK